MGMYIFPLALGLSIFIVGLTARGNYKNAGLWFALAVIGQAAALEIINAGTAIHYQHYRLFPELVSSPYRYFLVILIIQALIVVWSLRNRWRVIWTSITAALNYWQLGLLACVFLFSSAALSRVFFDYVFEIFFASLIQLISLATILLAAFAIPKPEMAKINQKLDGFLGNPQDNHRAIKPQVGKFGFILAIMVFGITACFSWFVYQRHPHVQDEVLYLYQARYLSQGMFNTPAPPVPEGFSIYLIPYKSERWYSPFPPGWPALLAIGTLLKAPWLVNPILAGVNILLAFLLFQFVLPIRYAKLSALLLSFSPWFLFMGMNFMSHTFMLTCTLAAGSLAALAIIRKKPAWGILAGVFIGVLSLIRPMDGLVVGALLGILLLFFNNRAFKAKTLIGYLTGAILVGALVFPYNQRVTGDPLKMPLSSYYQEYYGPNTYALGFGPDRGITWPIDPLPGYSPLEAVLNAVLNTFSVNIELFGWATGSIFLIALFLIGRFRHFTRLDYFFLASLVLTIGAYALFWFGGGPDFGARYWYLLIFPLLYFTGRAVQSIEEPKESFFNRDWGTRIAFTVLFLSVCAAAIYIPWRSLG